MEREVESNGRTLTLKTELREMWDFLYVLSKKGERKVVPVKAMKTYGSGGGGGIASLVLHLGVL
jgi:hypothetical protein